MAEYSSNLLINAYALESIDTGWTYNNAAVVSSGYSGSGFRLQNSGYIEQDIPIATFGTSINGFKLAIKAKFNNPGSIIFTDIILYVKLRITTEDSTYVYILPCQTALPSGESIWFSFEKEFEAYLTGITYAGLRVYTNSSTVITDIDNVELCLLQITTDAEQAYDDATEYIDTHLETHLADLYNAHLSDEQYSGLTGGAQRLRTVKLGLESDVHIANSNLYSAKEPIVTLDVVRKVVPLITPLHWQELLVSTVPNAVSTSIAVEKSGSSLGKIYIAYVADGLLVVKSAQFGYPISKMLWTVEERITGCLQCALEFDGSFVRYNDTVIFTTGTKPYLFYTDTDGALFYKILGEEQDILIGANVTAIDAIRGVASFYKDMDQGLLIFYIIAGTVYYDALINGVWEGQQAVSLAPENAVSIRAERTFDYRIVLQVADNTGTLYEIFSKMESGGWNGTEFITAALSIASEEVEVTYINSCLLEYISAALSVSSEILYGVSPIMASAANAAYTNVELELENDYGYKIILEWDERIFSVDGNALAFTLTDSEDTAFGCTSVEKTGDREITLLFQNFNNAIGNLTLTYTPGTMIGDVEAVEADSITFAPTGLVPFATEPPIPVSAENIEEWMA